MRKGRYSIIFAYDLKLHGIHDWTPTQTLKAKEKIEWQTW